MKHLKLVALLAPITLIVGCSQPEEPKKLEKPQPLQVQSIVLFPITLERLREDIPGSLYGSINLCVRFQGTGKACITWHSEAPEADYHSDFCEYWNVDTSEASKVYVRYYSQGAGVKVYVTVRDEDSTLLATSDTVFVQWE